MVRFIGKFRHIRGRINAYAFKLFRIETQQRSIVAAYIADNIAGINLRIIASSPYDVGQGVAHGLVDP